MSPGDETTTSDESSATTTPASTATSVDPEPTTSTSITNSTSSTSTTEVSTTLQTEDGTFIQPSDFSCLDGLRSEHCSKCSPNYQDCSEGLKCNAYADDGSGSWNDTKCVPLAPDPDLPGQPCTVEGSPASGIDSCDLHSICWDVDEATLIGTCVPFCTGSLDMGACPDGLLCAVFNDGVLPLCLPGCDPLQQDCPVDEVCIEHPDGTGFLCVLDGSGDEGQAFDPCSFANECDPGLHCGEPNAASECDPDASGCCLPFCDLTLPLDCPGAMQTCQPYFGMDPAPPGSENVGRCALP